MPVCSIARWPELMARERREVPIGVEIGSLAPSGKFVCQCNDEFLSRESWDSLTRVKDRILWVECPPQDRDVLRGVVLLAAAYYLGPAGAQLSGWQYVAANVAVGLFVNEILPPTLPGMQAAGVQSNPQQTGTSYSASLSGNVARLDDPIWKICGRKEITPPFASQPYLEYLPNPESEDEDLDRDQYLYALYAVGIGNHNIVSAKIGNTPISRFADVLVAQYLPPGTPPTTVLANVSTAEEVSGQVLDTGRYVGGFTACAARRTATHIGIDVVATRGLGKGEDPLTVGWVVEYRPINDFGQVLDAWAGLATETRTAFTATPQRWSNKYELPDVGRVEIRVARTDVQDTSPNALHEIAWSGLRAYLSEPAPLNEHAGHYELVMRASSQLSANSSRDLRLIVEAMCRALNSDLEWQAEAHTRNPEWWVLDLATSATWGINKPDTRVDLQSFYDLAQTSDIRQDRFDYVFDTGMSAWDAMQLIARAARARVFRRNDVISIARDELAEIPVTAFTPRNCMPGMTISETLRRRKSPDGVIVEYQDYRTNEWTQIECPMPGAGSPGSGNLPIEVAGLFLFASYGGVLLASKQTLSSSGNIYRSFDDGASYKRFANPFGTTTTIHYGGGGVESYFANDSAGNYIAFGYNTLSDFSGRYVYSFQTIGNLALTDAPETSGTGGDEDAYSGGRPRTGDNRLIRPVALTSDGDYFYCIGYYPDPADPAGYRVFRSDLSGEFEELAPIEQDPADPNTLDPGSYASWNQLPGQRMQFELLGSRWWLRGEHGAYYNDDIEDGDGWRWANLQFGEDTETNPPIYLRGIIAVGSELLAASLGSISHSSDNGDTWELVDYPPEVTGPGSFYVPVAFDGRGVIQRPGGAFNPSFTAFLEAPFEIWEAQSTTGLGSASIASKPMASASGIAASTSTGKMLFTANGYTWVPATLDGSSVDIPMQRPVRMRLPGITGPTHANREGLYEAASMLYRTRTTQCTTEMQGLLPAYMSPVDFLPDIDGYGSSGDVAFWDEDTLTMTLTEPPDWTQAPLYLTLIRDDGTCTDPLEVNPGPTRFEVVLPEAPDFELALDDGTRERPKYLIGRKELVKVSAIADGGKTEDGAQMFAIRGVIDDERVHQVDAHLLPGPGDLQDEPLDPNDAGGGGGGGGAPVVVRFYSDTVLYAGEDDPSLANMYARFLFRNDGVLVAEKGSDAVPTQVEFEYSNQWVLAGEVEPSVAALFEIRFDLVTTVDSTGNCVLTGDTLGTWLGLGTSRSITWSLADGETDLEDGAETYVVVRCRIREVATEIVQEDRVMTMKLTRIP